MSVPTDPASPGTIVVVTAMVAALAVGGIFAALAFSALGVSGDSFLAIAGAAVLCAIALAVAISVIADRRGDAAER